MLGRVSAIVVGLFALSVVILVGALVYFNPPKTSSGEVRFEGVTITTADTDGDGVRDVITMETNDGREIIIKPDEGKVETNNLVFEDTDGGGVVDTVEDKNKGKRWRIPGRRRSGSAEASGTTETNVTTEANAGAEENADINLGWNIPEWDLGGGWGDWWPSGGEEGNKDTGIPGWRGPVAIDIGAFKPGKMGRIPFGPPQVDNDSNTAKIPVLDFGTGSGVAIDVDGDGKYDMLQDKGKIFFDSDGDGEADTGYEEGDNYDVFVDFGQRRIAVDVGKDGSVNLWKEGKDLCIDLDGDGSCEVEAETDDSGNVGNYRYDEAKLGRFVGSDVLSKLNDPDTLEDYLRDEFGDYMDAWNSVKDWESKPAVDMPKFDYEEVQLPQLSPANPSGMDTLGERVGPPESEKEEACMNSINIIVKAAEHNPGATIWLFRQYVSAQLPNDEFSAILRRFEILKDIYRVENPQLVGYFTRNIIIPEENWPDADAPGRIEYCGHLYGYWYAREENGEWSESPKYMYLPLTVVCDASGGIYYLWYWTENAACFGGS